MLVTALMFIFPLWRLNGRFKTYATDQLSEMLYGLQFDRCETPLKITRPSAQATN